MRLELIDKWQKNVAIRFVPTLKQSVKHRQKQKQKKKARAKAEAKAQAMTAQAK